MATPEEVYNSMCKRLDELAEVYEQGIGILSEPQLKAVLAKFGKLQKIVDENSKYRKA